jgi:hypothetical protein
MRLVADGNMQQFSGIIESDVAFTSVSGANLEGADSAKLLTATSLSANLSVNPGRTDGVKFSVPSGAKLCLRDTGGTGVPIFLGTDVNDAVPVSAPVALNGTDACGDATDSPDVFAAAAVARKYHPGHYIALLRGVDAQSYMASSIKPGVKGFMKRYTWRELEPTQGTYNFNEITSDLAYVQSRGMRLIVMIEDKTFNNERPTPAYLDSLTLRNIPGGYSVLRWNTTVATRFKALLSAMGKKIDSHPALEGVATQETAHGFNDAQMNANGYTPEKYRDYYIDMLSSASVSFPTSRVFWFMNYLSRKQAYIANIATAVAPKGVIMGGPDVMPDDRTLASLAYPFYDQFKGKLPLFGQVEPSCYASLHRTAAPTKYWTMPELFRFARTDMHVNYMIWVRVPHASPQDAYDWNDALPVISSNGTFTPL